MAVRLANVGESLGLNGLVQHFSRGFSLRGVDQTPLDSLLADVPPAVRMATAENCIDELSNLDR
jgi:hypothetical protein